jgi:AraC family transcriptional regulator
MDTNPYAQTVAHIEAGPFTLNELRYAPVSAQQRHAHGDLGLTLLLSGSLEESVGTRQEIAQPLSVVVKPADTEHANRIGSGGAHTLQLRVRPQVLPPETALAWGWHHNGTMLREFIRLLMLFRSRAAQEIENASYDLIAAAQTAATVAPNCPPWLERVREQIHDVLPRPLRVHELAQHAGVHPVYLARQFRRFMGCSVSDYLAARRLQLAASALQQPRRPISAIAYQAGYADQSHLTRSFRRGMGVTPRHFRGLINVEVASVQDG